jgi:hypothetical protein
MTVHPSTSRTLGIARMGGRDLVRAIRAILRSCRIALVGNCPVEPEDAAAIDAHDIVVRFNGCANYGASGQRTDALALCKSGDSGRRLAMDPAAINADALASAREFWITKPPEVVAAEELASQGDVRVCGDAADAIVANRIAGRPWRILNASVYWAAKHVIAASGASASARPSSGLLALLHIKATFWRPRVTLYGFTHQGGHGHVWAAERTFIDQQYRWVARAQQRGSRSVAPDQR